MMSMCAICNIDAVSELLIDNICNKLVIISITRLRGNITGLIGGSRRRARREYSRM